MPGRLPLRTPILHGAYFLGARVPLPGHVVPTPPAQRVRVWRVIYLFRLHTLRPKRRCLREARARSEGGSQAGGCQRPRARPPLQPRQRPPQRAPTDPVATSVHSNPPLPNACAVICTVIQDRLLFCHVMTSLVCFFGHTCQAHIPGHPVLQASQLDPITPRSFPLCPFRAVALPLGPDLPSAPRATPQVPPTSSTGPWTDF